MPPQSLRSSWGVVLLLPALLLPWRPCAGAPVDEIPDYPVVKALPNAPLMRWLPTPQTPPSVLPAINRPPLLDARGLVQLALAQNVDVLYAGLQASIANEGFTAETGLYQPIAYATYRHEGRDRLRTVNERLTAALGGLTNLNEHVLTGEMGVRMKMPTGAEASLAWRATQTHSNVIASASFSPGDTEANGALVLTLRQPLLRGAGPDAGETDLRVAKAERDIGVWQYRQQVMRVSSDALSAYWQLQRAVASQVLRQEALANAQASFDDAQVRLQGGRVAPSVLDDARTVLTGREAELARGRQAVLEAEARVRVLLDLASDDGDWNLPNMAGEPLVTPPSPREVNERWPVAREVWPPLRVARLKREQAMHRLALALNKRLPALDVQTSYSTTSLAYTGTDAASQALRGRRPDWALGISLEVPLGTNRRAQAEYQAQVLRAQQAEIEAHSVEKALSSDMFNRSAQLEQLMVERGSAERELDARQALAEADKTQHELGVAPLSRLLRRQADVLDARLRMVDVEARIGLAQVAFQLVDGTLLDAYDVRIEN